MHLFHCSVSCVCAQLPQQAALQRLYWRSRVTVKEPSLSLHCSQLLVILGHLNTANDVTATRYMYVICRK